VTALGIIVGLRTEAACLPPVPEVRVACSGARPERARSLALQLIETGCGALASLGVAGALDPALKPGALLVADAVLTRDGRRLETDPRWRKRLIAQLARGGLAALPGTLVGSDHPLLLKADKADLFRDTGALAVDMESHAAARVAAEHGLPFLALRAISDPATRAVPSWVMDLVAEDGSVDPFKAAFEAMCRPWDIPALILLGHENDRALKALRRAAALTNGRLGLD
jgi:hopanoid-associated phosphorylase